MEEKKAIEELITELLTKLGFEVDIEINQENDVYHVHIKTEDNPQLLIGKHAHTLSAIQRIMVAALYKKLEKRVDVLVDVNDYRSGQKERLEKIAQNVAERVVNEDRAARLSSFSAYERKIIHEFIAHNYHSLESESEGEGGRRILVIKKKE